MPATRGGGIKARDKNLARDPDHYKKMGRLGGKASGKGGFASTVIGKDGLTGAERARSAGSTGGSISRRGEAKNGLQA